MAKLTVICPSLQPVCALRDSRLAFERTQRHLVVQCAGAVWPTAWSHRPCGWTPRKQDIGRILRDSLFGSAKEGLQDDHKVFPHLLAGVVGGLLKTVFEGHGDHAAPGAGEGLFFDVWVLHAVGAR